MSSQSMEDGEFTVARVRPNRRTFGLILFIIVINLIVSVVGGVAGFVLLSDSSASWARTARKVLQLENLQSVSLPTGKSTIRLEESSAVIDAVKKISPAVVSISVSQQVVDIFTRQVSTQEVGGGSGFVLTSDGLIVTNKHVVSQQGATYKVVLGDGRIFDATIKATDPLNDLAIVKIDAKDLQTVELGSSDDLEIGQSVIAIGNALGEYKNSVTYGVVSAKNRRVTASGNGSSETLTDLIQTDAAINPGNSGGPLANLKGQVVGINSVIASTSGGSIGVGFAISIDSIMNVIESVRKTGEIVRPYMGVRYLSVNKSIQQLNNLTVDYGALVSRGSGVAELAVMPGSPADKAGILEGDIILEINGERITEDDPLPRRLMKYSVGDEVVIKLMTKGEEKELKVTLDKLNSN